MAKAIKYTKNQLIWIKNHCTLARRDAHKKFCKQFNRKDVTLSNYTNLCKRNSWLTGRTGCYKSGHTPDNKGKKMPYNPNSVRTQFKKGNIPHNTKHLGHETLTKDGYIMVSIDKQNPHTGFERRYVLKHKYLWEKENGITPDNMCLKCLDGNKQNTDLDNWELIDRSTLIHLNNIDLDYNTAPKEAKSTIMNIAKLKTLIGSKQRNSVNRVN